MPLHIKRLIVLFVILITSFLVARHFLIPESFGQFGHYRGLALDEVKAQEAKYLGDAVCADCHEDIMDLKLSDLHAKISCETCHGPGWKHIEEPEPGQFNIPEGRDFCGSCHSINPARPDFIKQVNLREHNPEANCNECHNPHAPWN